jgi:hypothetical protein
VYWSTGTLYNEGFLNLDTSVGRLAYDDFETVTGDVTVYLGFSSNDGWTGRTNDFRVTNNCVFTLAFNPTAPAQPLKFVYHMGLGLGVEWTGYLMSDLFTNTHPVGCPFNEYDIFVT